MYFEEQVIYSYCFVVFSQKMGEVIVHFMEFLKKL